MKDTEGLRPALYKSQSPPINDFNFRSLCENTETKCVFAHIRATSGSVVTQVNSREIHACIILQRLTATDPFVFGRHVFMHNGVVSNFTDIRRDMTDMFSYDAFCNVLGSTDSEHAAALYMTYLTNHGAKDTWDKAYPLKAMHEALVKTALEIAVLQHQNLSEKATPNSLNFCVTDGQKMVAIRFRNHATQQPPSLYWSEFAGRTLNQKYEGNPDSAHIVNEQAIHGPEERIGKHTIIASEPTTYDESEWHLINKNCALTVDEFGTETEVPIEYDPKLNAKDPVYDKK